MIKGGGMGVGSILKVKGASSVLHPRYNEEVPLPAPKSPRGSHSHSITLEDVLTIGSPRMDSLKSTDYGQPESELSYMTSAFFATALEDFLTSIRIIGASQSNMRLLKANIDMENVLAKKYGIDTPVAVDELAGVTKENMDCEDFKLNKMLKDREYMENVMTETYKELAERRSYFTLINSNNEFEMQSLRSASIKEEVAKNRALRTKLRRQLRMNQQRNAGSMASTSEKLEKLQRLIEETTLLGNIKSQFVDHWQAARTEQHHEMIRSKEKRASDSIVMYKIKQEEEIRVHVEVDLLVGIHINEMLAQIEDLMIKYERDTEVIDLKIQKARSNYEEMVQIRNDLEKKVAHKHHEMLTWKKFKENRIRRIEYEKKMHHSAFVIQAWWRGLLVRHRMGPYRPRKGRRRHSRIRKKSNAD